MNYSLSLKGDFYDVGIPAEKSPIGRIFFNQGDYAVKANVSLTQFKRDDGECVYAVSQQVAEISGAAGTGDELDKFLDKVAKKLVASYYRIAAEKDRPIFPPDPYQAQKMYDDSDC